MTDLAAVAEGERLVSSPLSDDAAHIDLNALRRLPQQRDSQTLRRRASLYQAARQPRSHARRWVPVTALGLDLFAVALSVSVATAGHELLSGGFGREPVEYVPGLALAGPLVVLAWICCVALAGGYEQRLFGATAEEFSRVLHASLGCAGLVGVGSFLTRFDLSRGWFLLTFALGTLTILSARAGLRAWIKRVRRQGYLSRRVVVVGDMNHVDSVSETLRRESWLGYHVVGALAPSSEGTETASGIVILGDASDVAATALEAHADVVLIAGGAVTSPGKLREIAWDLEFAHAQLVVAPSLSDIAPERVRVRPVGGLPLIHLEKPRAAKAARLAKRAFDLVGASVVLLLTSPLFVYASLRIWAHDRGPLFFGQERIGRDGSPFTCYKFRTMALDAEERLQEVLDQNGLEHGAFAKLKIDPRITGPGHWLRRLSLDELPQLLNVVRGDMSLVGPRPQTAKEVHHYDNTMARRLHVRPGITGLWQVSGRSDLSAEESIRLDLYYVDNWSMMQDLAILARTVGAVLASRGAY